MGSITLDRPLVVDTHLHLWDKAKVGVSWTDDVPHFDRSFLLSQYSEDVKDWNVRALYMEVNADENAKKQEVEHIDALIKEDNFLEAAIYFGNPISPTFSQWIDELPAHAKGIRNILHIPSYPKGYCLQNRFISGMQFLAKKQVPFDLCIRATELEDAIALAEKCPDTQFVLDHCAAVHAEFDLKNPKGNQWEAWKKNLDKLGKLPNVHCKLSGLVSSLGENWQRDDIKPIVGQCLEAFQADNIIVGSDWPICTLTSTASKWYHVLHEVLLEMDKENINAIFSENAIKLYQL